MGDSLHKKLREQRQPQKGRKAVMGPVCTFFPSVPPCLSAAICLGSTLASQLSGRGGSGPGKGRRKSPAVGARGPGKLSLLS